MSFKILPLGVYLKHRNICLNYFGFLKICLNLIASPLEGTWNAER